MRFWWVNHKQTNKEELNGGYIWSPKANKNGARNETYLNLTRAQPGDRVCSYADGEIKAIGVVNQQYREAPKPSEFGAKGAQWTDIGWLVSIDWEKLESPPSPKKNIDRIRHFLPQKHSPIQTNGNGNQSCYLAEISSHLYQAILNICEEETLLLDEMLDLETDIIAENNEETKILGRRDISTTEIEQLVKARRGQGIYKNNLKAIEDRCRLTGVSDSRFLIASHIKPWRLCDDREKLDGNNGLLLSPHIDKLFDQGWISFNDNGELILATSTIDSLMHMWNLPTSLNVGEFNPDQQRYLMFHRKKIFRN